MKHDHTPTLCHPYCSAVKVGLVGGELVVNPPPHEAALAELALTYAGAGGGRALMVEAAGDQVRRWAGGVRPAEV